MRTESKKENTVPSDRYDSAYFRCCEGFEAFEQGHLSLRLESSLRRADLQPGMRLLDIGCGRGEFCWHAARMAAAAVGIDYSESSMQIAREAFLRRAGVESVRVAFARSDAKALCFADNSFDRVTLLDIVEHLHDWELERLFDEVHRVLRPGGRVIVHTKPNRLFYDVGYRYYTRWVNKMLKALTGRAEDSLIRTSRDPRDLFPYEKELHVNEQSPGQLRRLMGRRFRVRIEMAFHLTGSRRNLLYYAVARLYPLSLLPGLRSIFADEIWAMGTKESA